MTWHEPKPLGNAQRAEMQRHVKPGPQNQALVLRQIAVERKREASRRRVPMLGQGVFRTVHNMLSGNTGKVLCVAAAGAIGYYFGSKAGSKVTANPEPTLDPECFECGASEGQPCTGPHDADEDCPNCACAPCECEELIDGMFSGWGKAAGDVEDEDDEDDDGDDGDDGE